MTQNVAPGLAGSIDAPSRLELFWEKNKRLVNGGLIAAVIAIGAHYAWKYKVDRDRSEAWAALAVAANLDEGYAKPSEMWDTFKELIPQNPGYVGGYYYTAQTSLVAGFAEQVKAADDAKLRTLASGDDGRAPLALWALSNRAIARGEFDSAISSLAELQKRFPEHFLCKESSFPVQWRPEIKPAEEPKPDARRKKPELEPARPGSLVAMRVQQVEAERGFRSSHPEYYSAPEADSAETIIFEFEGAGVVKFKLFSTRTPKHAERLLALAREGWWVGQRVHLVERAPSSQSFNDSAPSHFVFGWPSTKEAENSKWKEEDLKPENIIEVEDSAVSLFPGMVSVELAKDSKSQVERIVINAEDEAAAADGNRVVVGRVTEGLEIVREIVSGEFADDASAKSGRGRPQNGYKITAVRVE